MHSSRMRTACCSGHPGGGKVCRVGGLSAWVGICLGDVSAWVGFYLDGVYLGERGICLGGYLPGGCLPGSVYPGVSAWGGVSLGRCLPRGVYPSMHWGRHPPPRGQNSSHMLVKHYLSATTLRTVKIVSESVTRWLTACE